jgi:hypothetical protein
MIPPTITQQTPQLPLIMQIPIRIKKTDKHRGQIEAWAYARGREIALMVDRSGYNGRSGDLA